MKELENIKIIQQIEKLSKKLKVLEKSFTSFKTLMTKSIEEHQNMHRTQVHNRIEALKQMLEGLNEFIYIKNINDNILFKQDHNRIEKNQEVLNSLLDLIQYYIIGEEDHKRDLKTIEDLREKLGSSHDSDPHKILMEAFDKVKPFTFDPNHSTDNIRSKKESRETLIKMVKRLIELKQEFWKKGNSENAPYIKKLLYGKSEGIDQALTVIDGFLDYDPEIHKLIDDSRKN